MSRGSVGIAVVGYGYWGPNLVRNFANIDGAEVVAVSDLEEQRLSSVKRQNVWFAPLLCANL